MDEKGLKRKGMKNIIRIFMIVLAIEVIVVGGIILYLSGPIDYSRYDSDHFSCEIPDGGRLQVFDEYGWRKHQLDAKGIMYFSHMKMNRAPKETLSYLQQTYLQGAVFSKRLQNLGYNKKTL